MADANIVSLGSQWHALTPAQRRWFQQQPAAHTPRCAVCGYTGHADLKCACAPMLSARTRTRGSREAQPPFL